MSAAPLCELQIQTTLAVPVGMTPFGTRHVDMLGGHFAGPRLSGVVLGGMDRLTRTADGRYRADARLLLRTDAGDPLDLEYRGVAEMSDEQLAQIMRGEMVDYYHRISAQFASATPALDWLNGTLVIGSGRIRPGAEGRVDVAYRLFGVA